MQLKAILYQEFDMFEDGYDPAKLLGVVEADQVDEIIDQFFLDRGHVTRFESVGSRTIGGAKYVVPGDIEVLDVEVGKYYQHGAE